MLHICELRVKMVQYLNVEGPRVVADAILATPAVVTQNLNHLNFPLLLWQFLYTQLTPSSSTISVNNIPHSHLLPTHLSALLLPSW